MTTSLRAASVLFGLLLVPALGYGNKLKQKEILAELDFQQRIGNSVPMDVSFVRDNGEETTLAKLASDKPILLNLVYYECPMLCTLVLNGVLKALRVMDLKVYEDFDVVTISIDPRENPTLAREKKGYYLKKYGREKAAQGWHFLTGTKESIDAVADAVGFSYMWDEERKQYAHAAGTIFLTPKGVVSRYLFGIEFVPRDMRLALIEASNNKLGSPVDRLLLYCFQYNPEEGKYGLLIMNVLRLAGLLTVFLLIGYLLVMLRNERKRRKAALRDGGSVEFVKTGIGER